MQTKLTLRLDDHLIEQAKRYAARRGTSVSQMVAAYFQTLTADPDAPLHENDDWKNDLAPITRSLVGRFASNDLSEDNYYRS
jgi:hypothetical protein